MNISISFLIFISPWTPALRFEYKIVLWKGPLKWVYTAYSKALRLKKSFPFLWIVFEKIKGSLNRAASCRSRLWSIRAAWAGLFHIAYCIPVGYHWLRLVSNKREVKRRYQIPASEIKLIENFPQYFHAIIITTLTHTGQPFHHVMECRYIELGELFGVLQRITSSYSLIAVQPRCHQAHKEA